MYRRNILCTYRNEVKSKFTIRALPPKGDGTLRGIEGHIDLALMHIQHFLGAFHPGLNTYLCRGLFL